VGVGVTGLGMVMAASGCAAERWQGIAIQQADPNGNMEYARRPEPIWRSGPLGGTENFPFVVDKIALSESREASYVRRDESWLSAGCDHTRIRPRGGLV
jgi:hypothetical protein